MEHQHHFGRKFYLDKKTGYWVSTDYPRVRAHVWVWESNNGKRPKGHHIHHINGNKSDNTIDNLEIMKQEEHLRLHMTDARREWAAQNVKKFQHRTKAWHDSEEGQAWHSRHAKTTFERKNEVSKCCEKCGMAYGIDLLDYKRSRFCSNICKSSWRRQSGRDDVERRCSKCNELFRINKYAKTKRCTSCSGRNKVDKKGGA